MPDCVDAREYHERTKHSPESLRASDTRLDFSNKPTPYKVYRDLPRVAFADRMRPPQVPALAAVADSGPDPGSAPARSLDADVLAQLCHYSAGVTKEIRRGDRELLFRAAACTGTLYHVDLYLVVGDDVAPTTGRVAGGEPAESPGDGAPGESTGLDAGVYHFDPRTRSLDVLREGDYRGVLAEATGDEQRVADAPLTVVATSTWWRNAWKYRERTYRHAFWDSGTVLANLLAVAHALDLPASVVAGFADERVASLLGVDVDREAPLELVAVGSGSPAPESPAVDPIDPATEPLSAREEHYDLIPAAYRGSVLPDGEAAREWRERRSPDVPERASGDPDRTSEEHGSATTRVDEPPSGEARSAGSDGDTREYGDGRRISLDPVTDDRMAKTPLHVTVERRGSCREYARDTLNRRKVGTVFDRAVRGFPADFRDPAGPALQLNDCYLVVHDVADVPAGAYRYHPEADELELLRAGEFRREAGHLALDQQLAADAGLCAFFLTDLDAAVDRLGERGYRAAQLEAAVTAGRLYLAAYAHRDLGATGLTFYDDLVTEFFEPRAAGLTPTFLWTLGRPA